MTKKIIGIRREDINKWERRVPLIPAHVRELIRSHSLEIYVQPSDTRIFPDSDYLMEGVRVREDISPCSFIMAVKEIPIEKCEKDKVYTFFSHTAKGQPHNMPMLKKMMELGCSIIDYEKIVNDKGQRLMSFGEYAGHAGMIDTLWALGRRLKLEGIETPFLRLEQAVNYSSLVEAKEEVSEVGRLIRKKGLSPQVTPFVCGFMGYGRVSKGAQEIFDLLPSEEVSPRNMPGLFMKGRSSARGLYKVVFKEKDMVKPINSGRAFDLQDYYVNPQNYAPVMEDHLQYLTVLIVGIYWTPKFPKLITKSFLRKFYGGESAPRLRVIGDITCDIDGSVECTVQPADSDNPVYVFDVETDRALIGIEGKGPVVMAVFNLPAELPLESSAHFSGCLKKYVPAFVAADFRGEFSRCGLPPEVQKAVILYRGKLTPAYEYLTPFVS